MNKKMCWNTALLFIFCACIAMINACGSAFTESELVALYGFTALIYIGGMACITLS